MTLQELEEQLAALSPIEKAEAIRILTQSISSEISALQIDTRSRGITKTPGVCGGEACIANTRIPVWILVETKQLGINEARLLEDYPHLTAADLVNAWVYASANAEEIQDAIRRNNEDD